MITNLFPKSDAKTIEQVWITENFLRTNPALKSVLKDS